VSYLLSYHRVLTPTSIFLPSTNHSRKKVAILISAALLGVGCFAQEQPLSNQSNPDSAQTQSEVGAMVTIPAGTRLALVLSQPIQSRYVRRGDDIYAQVQSPVSTGGQVVIPPGTFVQGTVESIGRNGGRGELHLQSMSITFPDGYVTPIAGPITVRTDEGYAIKDPGNNRSVGAFALPAAGAGLGALIGHSVGQPDSSTTSPFPAGCTGPPPFCTTVTTPTYGTKGRDTVIGAAVGGGIGFLASMTLLFSSHHFYVDAGAPIQMTLQQSVTLRQDEVAKAVQNSAEHPLPPPQVAPRPWYYPPGPDISPPPSTGNPPMIIPGPPGPDGVPGAPIVIPQ